MLATARARLAAVMNAIRGRVPVAPVVPTMPTQPDMTAALERLDRIRVDMEALKATLGKK